ncbi:MAG: hypothetical protein ABR905_01410 [Terracidiphilus sp.]|jgi:hypothetical protein
MAEYDEGQCKAFDLYARAVKLRPDDSEACYELGKMQALAGNIQETETPLAHAAQIDQANAFIHFRLGRRTRSWGAAKMPSVKWNNIGSIRC